MICRNKVADFDVWKSIFDENLEGAKAAGLKLENMWRCVDDPNNVFFIFLVESMEGANKFISDPSAAETGRRSGVIDGECWFVE